MRMPRFLRPFVIRPYMVMGLGVMIGIYFCAWDLAFPTRAIVAWDCGVATFLGLTFSLMARRASTATLARRAEEADEGRWTILWVSIAAAALTITALVAELSAAKGAAPDQKAVRVALTAVTVGLSWTFVHVVFALHYAHEFYGRPDEHAALQDGVFEVGERTAPGDAKSTRSVRRDGLTFPGEDKTPDFQDFLHFALVIGVANQTADIQITSKAIRRVVTLHGTIAFLFNTVILALAINAAAGLL